MSPKSGWLRQPRGWPAVPQGSIRLASTQHYKSMESISVQPNSATCTRCRRMHLIRRAKVCDLGGKDIKVSPCGHQILTSKNPCTLMDIRLWGVQTADLSARDRSSSVRRCQEPVRIGMWWTAWARDPSMDKYEQACQGRVHACQISLQTQCQCRDASKWYERS